MGRVDHDQLGQLQQGRVVHDGDPHEGARITAGEKITSEEGVAS